MEVRQIYEILMYKVAILFPQVKKIHLSWSAEDDDEHWANRRHYATFRAIGKEMHITYAKDMENLPDNYKAGILLHELGHAIDEITDGSNYKHHPNFFLYMAELQNIEHEDKEDEAVANLLIVTFFNTHIFYDHNLKIQYIEERKWRSWLS